MNQPQEPQQYDVEFVYGKRYSNNQIEYYIKWVGFSKLESTWEPINAFDQISQQLLVRFERCQSYKQYHQRIYKRESKINIRIHILNKGRQIYRQYPVRSERSHSTPFINVETGYTHQHVEEQQYPGYPERRGRGRPRKEGHQRDLSLKISINKYEIEKLSHISLLPPLQPLGSPQKQLSYKTEKDYIYELIQSRKHQIDKKRREQDVYIYKSYVKLPYNHCNKEQESQQFQLLNLKYFDKNLKCQVSDGKVQLELIISHHLFISKQLLYKCQTSNGETVYFDFETLKDYYPTLLLDYLTYQIVWKKMN